MAAPQQEVEEDIEVDYFAMQEAQEALEIEEAARTARSDISQVLDSLGLAANPVTTNLFDALDEAFDGNNFSLAFVQQCANGSEEDWKVVKEATGMRMFDAIQLRKKLRGE
jgi:predicted transcriptional regulator